MKKVSIPKTLKVTLAFTICNVIQKGIAFITIPFFTRLLTTSQMGQVTVYMSWLEVLTVFLTLQLPYGSFSKAMIKYEKNRDEYLASVEGICLLLFAIYMLVLMFLGTWISSMTHLSVLLLSLMGVEILANSGIAFWSARKRFEYEYLSVVVITLAISILSPLMQFVLIFCMNERGEAKIWGNSLVLILFGLCVFLYSIFRGKRIFDITYWKYALSFNIPLIPYYLSQIVFNSCDRIMIDSLQGEDKAGIYGVVYNLAFVLLFVLNSFNNAYTPWFLNKLKKDDVGENVKLSIIVSVCFSSLILLVILFAPEMVMILGGSCYLEAVWIVPPVALSLVLLFYTQIFANYEFFYEKKLFLIVSSVLSASVNIILNYLFIPKLGYIAAGYTTFISYFILMIINLYAAELLNRNMMVKSRGYDKKQLFTVLLGVIIISCLFMCLYKYLIIRLIIFLFFLVSFVVFRKRFVSIALAVKGIMRDEND